MTTEVIEMHDEYTDPEVAAIAEIAACMGILDPAAQDRIASWVFDRYRLPTGEENTDDNR